MTFSIKEHWDKGVREFRTREGGRVNITESQNHVYQWVGYDSDENLESWKDNGIAECGSDIIGPWADEPVAENEPSLIPTKSPALYTQFVGRVSGVKPAAKLLDELEGKVSNSTGLETPQKTAPFYLVWNTCRKSPAVRHPNLESAQAEAKRVATKQPGETVMVLQPVWQVIGEVNLKVEEV